MDIFQAIILGVVEGLTEFLPISSTGHLIVVSDWLGLEQNAQNKAFDVIIQLSAILAVALNYKDKINFSHISLWSKVFVAFLPLAIVGFIFKDIIKELFSSNIVAIMFIVGGVVFLVVEYFYKEQNSHIDNVEDIGYKQSLWIGIAQVFALIPGTSRAGASIIGALIVGLNRKASAEFSFLLALPVMGAVAGYDLLKHYELFLDTSFAPLIVGFVVSFVVAFIVMRVFLRFLEKFTFVAFGIYRIVFGLLLLWWI
jgi:undecaprenyl-diphosphatase